MALHLVRDRGHHRVTIDPAADNAAAIRCYERVTASAGVGVLREYWRDGDGGRSGATGVLDGPARERAAHVPRATALHR